MVTSLTKSESSQGEETGTTVFAAREVGKPVDMTVGVVKGAVVKFGSAVAAGGTAAVWAAKTVCAAAVLAAPAPVVEAGAPEPHALSRTAGIRMDPANQKGFFIMFPPTPFSAETMAPFDASAKVYRKTGKKK
jgi:hypothetical protein